MKQANTTEHQLDDLYQFLKRIQTWYEDDGEICDETGCLTKIDDLHEWLVQKFGAIDKHWERSYWATRSAWHNAADPNNETLNWKPEIEKAIEYFKLHKDATPLSVAWLLENGWTEQADGQFERDRIKVVEGLNCWMMIGGALGAISFETVGELNSLADLQRRLIRSRNQESTGDDCTS